MDNPQHSLDDALVEVEELADAIWDRLASIDSAMGDGDAIITRAQLSEVLWEGARAALEAAGVAELRAENERLRKALTGCANFLEKASDRGMFTFDGEMLAGEIASQARAALNPRQNEEEGETHE